MKGDAPSWLEVVDVATGQTSALADARPLWSYYPNYAADGRQVVFSVSPEHHAGEDWDLAVVDPAAPGGFRRLTQGRGNDRVPDWRP
jgi:Tol biopolymer transport system component